MSITGILLGLINIGIVVALLVLVGLVIIWILQWLSLEVPEQVRKVYLVIVALVALYMVVSLILGMGLPFAIVR